MCSPIPRIATRCAKSRISGRSNRTLGAAGPPEGEPGTGIKFASPFGFDGSRRLVAEHDHLLRLRGEESFPAVRHDDIALPRAIKIRGHAAHAVEGDGKIHPRRPDAHARDPKLVFRAG